jgi:CubicO group peptidase (beta-lactamase class C family)
MTIDGWTARGFENVREVFEKNFEAGLELGAAFSAYVDGEKVVDLWGGIADDTSGRAWTEDTLVPVFSSTKGATAICANRLLQEGRLALDAPVTEYWPEFGAAGKQDVTVEQLLSHQAGLAWVDAPLTLEEALDWEPMIRALEAQAPSWEPGTQHGYHAITFGNLVGELVRRVTGKTVGTYFREEVAQPLQLEFFIGLPADRRARVARLTGGIVDTGRLDDEARELMNQFIGPDTDLGKALSAGGAFAGDVWNKPEVHAAEVPAAAGVSDARSLARMYAACIGEVDGIRLLTEEQLRDATTQRTQGPNTVLLGFDLQFGLGFILPSSLIQLGGPRSFGHFGAGGSAGWADPEAGMAFGYVMNRMDMGLAGDARSYSLVNACYDASR